MNARRRLAVFGALFAFVTTGATVAGEQAASAHWWSTPSQPTCVTVAYSYPQYHLSGVYTYCGGYWHQGGGS